MGPVLVPCFDSSMASAPATAISNYSTEGDPRTHRYDSMSSPPTSPTATLVNTVHPNERPSVMFKIPGGKSNILNSVVADAAGQSVYTILSNSKRTTFVACQNKVEVATVQWNRSSPRMVFRGKKIKCKEWLPTSGLGTESRVLAHGGSQFIWMQRSSSTSGYLIPANRPGLSVARWRVSPHSDDLDLEIFQEALVEPGLLEAIVLSVVLLRSGRSLCADAMGMLGQNQLFNSHIVSWGTY